jgi:hypothetical protein
MSHVALDFDEALENFKTMFPGVPEDIITDLLRRENGDVEKVVNELLAFSSNPTSSRASGSSARNSDIFYLEPPPPYSEVCKKQESQPTFSSRHERQEPSKSTPSSSRSSTVTTTTTQNETIDDEKIALMIQNEEFLNYLRNNQTFMREIYGANSSRSAPRSNASAISRPYSSSSSGNSLRYSLRDSYTSLTPNGPHVEVAATSIPNGPLVDYNYNDSTIWSKKIMSKLPGRKSSDYSYTADTYNSTALEPYYSSSDLSSKLKAMSKTSKLMFITLAKKFWSRPQLKLLPDYNDSKPRRTL